MGQIAFAVLCGALLVAIVGWIFERRRSRDLGAELHAMERSVELLSRVQTSGTKRGDRLEVALDELDQGVMLGDASGAELYRNRVARSFASARHGEALVEAEIRRSLSRALGGSRSQVEVELHSTPRRTFSVRAAPLFELDSLVGGLVVVEDLTDQRRLDEVRRDFVANVSHELKNPLGALGLLVETIADETDQATLTRLAERAQIEVFRLSDLVDDLLDLSVIEHESGRALAPVDVAELIKACADEVADRSDEADVTVVCRPPKADLSILGDEVQLRIALTNLIDNAIKFSRAGQVVDVTAMTDHEDPTMIRLDVIDRGLGIPERDKPRVFERFYRSPAHRSKRIDGTGLGLSMVGHAVENHRGTVEFTSSEGQGSCFTMRLPLATETPAPLAMSEGQ